MHWNWRNLNIFLIKPNSGGALSYSYQWSTNDTTEDITGLAAGTYSILVLDTLGAFIIDSVIISEPDSIVTSLISTDINCFSGSDGTITLSITGGSSPFSYNWSNGDTVQNPSGLLAGQYIVTITDANNCTISDSIVLTEPATVISAQIFSKEETASLNDGIAWVVVSGGTPSYSYIWNDPNQQTNDTAFNLVAGNYQVVYIDANGCRDSLSVVVSDSTSVGIFKDLQNYQFAIFPNPSSGKFYVHFNEVDEIKIYTINGKLILSKDVSDKEKTVIDTILSQGVYLIHFIRSNTLIIQKVIIR